MKRFYELRTSFGLLSTFLISFSVFAEPQRQTFETGIKAWKAEMIPYEYSRDQKDAEPFIGYEVKNLKNNHRIIHPFFFVYKNFEKGYAIEFDYTNIQIPKAYYEYETYTRFQQYVGRIYLRNNERTDYRLNVLLFPSERWQDLLAIGIGLRKIDRLRNDEEENFYAEERVKALGPQFALKSKVPLLDSLSLELGLDFYHSQGKRNYSFSNSELLFGRSGAYSRFQTIVPGANTKGIFQGIQADVALKYRFWEHFNLAIGYNYHYSYFRYEDLNDTYYSFSTFNNSLFIEDSRLSNGKEIIRGFYLSASSRF